MASEGCTADDIFAAINAFRADPASFIPALKARLDCIDDNKIVRVPGQKVVKTQEGAAAVEEAIAALEHAAPARQLQRSPAMDRACGDHVTGTEADNYGHTGTDGSSPSDRLNRYGKWERGHGENLGFLHDAVSGDDVVVSWLIDDGVPDRGHRYNLLRGCWTYGGIAIGPHPGPVSYKIVGLFASDYNAPGEEEAPSETEFKNAAAVVPADDVFAEINRFRADPSSYLPALRARLSCTDDMKVMHLPDTLPLMTHEGKAAIEEAIKAVQEASPLEQLERNYSMDSACEEHLADCGTTGALGHVGKDGSTPGDRASRYGTWHKAYGENLAYFCWKAEDVIVNWLVDDGVPARGHRVNLLRPEWRLGGVAAGAHKNMESMYIALFADVFEEDGGEEED